MRSRARRERSGYAADPSCDRGNAKMQHLFVNGRWIRDRSLGHAVQEAYRGLLMTGRYAIAFLFLDLPTDQVDVNVHPTKSEVRFRHPQSLHHLVYASVKAALRKANLVPRLHATSSVTPTASVVRPAELQFAARPALRVVPEERDFRREPASGAQSHERGLHPQTCEFLPLAVSPPVVQPPVD